jgi:hypothetical protein
MAINKTGAATALLPLHSLQNVNTVIGMLYDENGVYRAGFDPNIFYNTILIDTLKYGEENYVHLKAAESLTIRRGDNVARFRRWAGLTPSLTPLKEGIPPAPDKHAYETIEVGNVFSFGRWSEYTDKIDLSIVNEVIAERSVQYGEVANQTKELYARKTWLATPNEFFAAFKAGFGSIAFGDEITLDDLRFLVARMKRMMVKPVGGKYNYVCSAEFINGLIDDPRIKQYMEIEQTTGKLWTSGETFDMFELTFIPTMLDEFAYPDIEFPGVYEKADATEVIRLYAVQNVSATVATFFYLDVHQDFVIAGSGNTEVKAKVYVNGTSYLKDGSAIEELVRWEVGTTPTTTFPTLVAGNIQASLDEAIPARCRVMKSTRTLTANSFGVLVPGYTALEAVTSASGATSGADLAAINSLIDAGEFMQLPVHRGILFGAEALVKLVMEGVSDAPKIIIKSLGSSGVADPIDQRQSIGFKVDGFGLAIKRPEAVVVTYGIPKHAELAALSAKVVFAPYQPSFLTEDQAYEQNNKNSIGLDGAQKLRVDGVNLGGVPGSPAVQGNNAPVPFYVSNAAYKKGQFIQQPFTITVRAADGTAVKDVDGVTALTTQPTTTEIRTFVFIRDVAVNTHANFAALLALSPRAIKPAVDALERDVLEGAQGNDKGSNIK